jgi:predicted helicase
MSALQDLLSQYRELSKEQRGKGTLFELLIKDFLQNDPTFAPQFSEVWTFAEWAKLEDKPQNDDGIDLVAKRVDEEGFCAIQCKFYDESHTFGLKDFGTYFAQLGDRAFSSGLIFDTTRCEWSKNAEEALGNQSKPVQRIGLVDLENSAIDWSAYTPNRPVQLKSKKSLRPHQVAALKAVADGLEHADRGKLIMVSQNAFKGGMKVQLKEFRQILREQKELLEKLK